MIKLVTQQSWVELWKKCFYALIFKTFHTPFHSPIHRSSPLIFSRVSDQRSTTMNNRTRGRRTIPEVGVTFHRQYGSLPPCGPSLVLLSMKFSEYTEVFGLLDLVSCPDPTHVRARGLVTQSKSLGPLQNLKASNEIAKRRLLE